MITFIRILAGAFLAYILFGPALLQPKGPRQGFSELWIIMWPVLAFLGVGILGGLAALYIHAPAAPKP